MNMGKNIFSLQLLRNGGLYSSKAEAINAIKAGGTQDGVIKLGRYNEGDGVKTVFGINYVNTKDSTVTGASYTIFDNGEAAVAALQAQLDTLNGADTVEGSIAKSIKDAINAINAETVANAGQAITSVTQTNGVISAEVGDIAAAHVTMADTVLGADVESALVNLNAKITKNTVTSDDKSVTVSTSGASTDLSVNIDNTTIVKDAMSGALKSGLKILKTIGSTSNTYKLVYGDSNTEIGDIITVDKDRFIEDISYSAETQSLVITYHDAEGKVKTSTVDLSEMVVEGEAGDGLASVNHKLVVKLADGNEAFLTVGKNGLKLSGVQDAIDTAITTEVTNRDNAIKTAVEALDAEVESTDGTNVQVKVTEVNGKITAVNVSTDNTANKSDFDGLKSDVDALSGKSVTEITSDGSIGVTKGTAKNGTVTYKVVTDASKVKLNGLTMMQTPELANVNSNSTVTSAIQAIDKAIDDKADKADAKLAKKLETVTINGHVLNTGTTEAVINGAEVKLDGYTIATANTAVAATDAVNDAIAKVEYKADHAGDDALNKIKAGNGIDIPSKADGSHEQTVSIKLAPKADGLNENPLTVDANGLKFATYLDAGEY